MWRLWKDTIAKLCSTEATNRDLRRIITAGSQSGNEARILRKAMVAICDENRDLRDTIHERDKVIERNRRDRLATEARHAQEVAALHLEIARLQEKCGEESGKRKNLEGRIKRYENRNMPGRTATTSKDTGRGGCQERPTHTGEPPHRPAGGARGAPHPPAAL